MKFRVVIISLFTFLSISQDIIVVPIIRQYKIHHQTGITINYYYQF